MVRWTRTVTPLRAAVFGAGTVGRLRARALHANPQTTLVAIADPASDVAAAAAAAARAEVFDDYRALLDRVPIDLAIISTPTPLHEPMAIAALEAGAHVICEKPLSATVESCRRILAVAETRG